MAHPKTEQIRVTVASGFLIAAFSGAALSQINRQVISREATIDQAMHKNRFTTHRTIFARRGSLFANDGTALAQDQEVYELNVNFEKIPKVDAFYLDVSAATGLPASEFATLAVADSTQKVHRNWHRPVTGAQATIIDDVKQRWRANGLSVKRIGRRRYPLGELASGVTGVVRDGHALTGLEASQDKSLHGTNAERIGLTDRFGAFLPMRMDPSTGEPHDGKDITTTIDRDLQAAAAATLKRTVEQHQAENGAAIVIDPHTGDILSLATWPAFAPYAPDGSESDLTKGNWFNVAVRGVLEPGSTFKVLTLAMALDSGAVTMDTVTSCAGAYKPSDNSIIHCDNHHGVRAHGNVTPRDAIARSCNISAAIWARAVGVEHFESYVDKLGLTEPTKIGFANEAKGDYDHNQWAWKIRLANMGFGQSITSTPLEMADAFCTLANGGVRIPPRLIKKIGSEIQPNRPGIKVFSKSACDQVISCMQAVMDDPRGTGKTLGISGYELAGKTGTAQKKNNSKNGYVSNFVGMVPAKNPRAVILVMVNKPKDGIYYGAAVAGPVFHEIAQAVIRRYGISPSRSVVSAALPKNALSAE